MVAAERGLVNNYYRSTKRSAGAYYLVLIVIVIIAYLTDKLWEKAYDKLFPTEDAMTENSLPHVIEFENVSKVFNPGHRANSVR